MGIIRPYGEDDLQAITDIYNESVIAGGVTADLVPRTLEQRAAWVDEHTPREVYPVVVATDGAGTVVGFGSLSRFHQRQGFDGVVEVSYYVASQECRHGYGSALLEHLLAQAESIGHRLVVALLFDENKGSAALVQRYGFTRFGLLPRASRNSETYSDLAYWYRPVEGHRS